ncbi:MAG: hypothetical protein ACOCXA_08840, partial [Planctomycetota bacterium]
MPSRSQLWPRPAWAQHGWDSAWGLTWQGLALLLTALGCLLLASWHASWLPLGLLLSLLLLVAVLERWRQQTAFEA